MASCLPGLGERCQRISKLFWNGASVFHHAFADALEYGEAAKKKDPREPSGYADIANNHAGHRQPASFQGRVLTEARQCDMPANDAGDPGHEKEAATKSEQPH